MSFLHDALRARYADVHGEPFGADGTILGPAMPVVGTHVTSVLTTPSIASTVDDAILAAAGNAWDTVTDPFRTSNEALLANVPPQWQGGAGEARGRGGRGERGETDFNGPAFAEWGADSIVPAEGGGLTASELAAANALKSAVAAGSISGGPSPIVSSFQEAYNGGLLAGVTPLAVDGLWGPKTKAALAEFERPGAGNTPPSPGLTPSAGPGLVPASGGPVSDMANRLLLQGLTPGTRTPDVLTFQKAWNAGGYSPLLGTDGIWGPATAAAVNRATGRTPKPKPLGPDYIPTVPSTPNAPLEAPGGLVLGLPNLTSGQWWAVGGVLGLGAFLMVAKPWKSAGSGQIPMRRPARSR